MPEGAKTNLKPTADFLTVPTVFRVFDKKLM